MKALPWLLPAGFVALGAVGLVLDEPAPIAGDAPSAVLRFEILDEAGAPIPGRLTFVGEGVELFPNVGARPEELAVRKNVVYTKSGVGAITVPAGTYEIYASRGIEWSLDRTELHFEEGWEYRWTARLRHEVDTTGWVSGDYHLHTLTYSGHGDANMEERVISLVGEGLEFAVATDHNHNTDYDPTIAKLGVGERIRAVVGNEVSTPIGHFNAFPLEPDRPVPDPDARDANALFKFIREEPNRYGVTPVIQLNHPRWLRIDYFGRTGLDPVTGESSDPAYSSDFDSLEVLNENVGWGYYNADTTDRYVGEGIHSVLEDWFVLLNRGHRYAAVGNSDSHTVHAAFGGYPRNYSRSSTDAPSEIDPAEVAAAIRAKQVFTTTGPFVELEVNGVPMGGDARAEEGGVVTIRARIRAASWIDVDRLLVVINGRALQEWEIPEVDGVLVIDETEELTLRRDAWIAVLVEGDDSLAPIIPDAGRPILPLAITNPVWVDVDGDGEWTPPWLELPPGDFASLDRHQLLLAARAAERAADPELLEELALVWQYQGLDTYARIALLRAMNACGAEGIGDELFKMMELHGKSTIARYDDEFLPLLGGHFVRDWMAIGYFPNPDETSVLTAAYPPESNASVEASFPGKAGEAAWRELRAEESGYLDLRAIDPEHCENAIAYAQTWLHAPDAREVFFALGTDDGAKVWCNETVLHEDASRHGASPLQEIGRMQLAEGWNRILFKVENGGGGFGLYFRVLDGEVTSAATKP